MDPNKTLPKYYEFFKAYYIIFKQIMLLVNQGENAFKLLIGHHQAF